MEIKFNDSNIFEFMIDRNRFFVEVYIFLFKIVRFLLLTRLHFFKIVFS